MGMVSCRPAAPQPSRNSVEELEANPRQGILSFLEAMTWNWPTWVNSSEFLLLPAARKFLSASSFSTLFRLGWGAAGRQLTIPIVRGAPLEAGHWPVVVFSHGM